MQQIDYVNVVSTLRREVMKNHIDIWTYIVNHFIHCHGVVVVGFFNLLSFFSPFSIQFHEFGGGILSGGGGIVSNGGGIVSGGGGIVSGSFGGVDTIC